MDGPDRLDLRADDEAAMRALGSALAQAALPLPPHGFLVDLRGDLGMGKTVFVRGVATGLGVAASEAVVSPTFTIARSYAAGGLTLHHIDAYRLRDASDLDAAGFEEMWGDGCLTCVEWGARVVDALPPDRMEVTLEMHPDAGEELLTAPGDVPVFPRLVRFRAAGPAARTVLQALRRLLAVEEAS